MVPNGTNYDSFPSFADTGTRVQPSPAAKYSQGFLPGETFPAEWQNYFMHGATSGITRLNADTLSIKKELNTILSEYGITNDDEVYNQLYTAFRRIAPQICTSDTAAGTAAKLVAITGDGTALKAGNIYSITFTNANTAANPTLSINSGTAYPMCDSRGIALKSGAWAAGDVVTVLFTGAKFLMGTNAVDAIENGNQNAVTSNAVSCISASTTTITGPRIGNGGTVKIMFTTDMAGSDTSTGFAINYNGVSTAVKVNQNGTIADFVATEVATDTYKYLQANTTLCLVFNGTYFVIVGNPVVISSASEKIHADGTVERSAAFRTAGALKTYGIYLIDDTSETLGSTSKTFTINDTDIVTEVGTVLKITFQNALQSSNTITEVKLTAGGKTGKIVAQRPGISSSDLDYAAANLRNLRSHEFAGGNYSSTYKHKVWDKYTTLEVMWTGTYWLVMGNPVLCSYFSSNKGYSVYADGKIEQWGEFDCGSNQSNYRNSQNYMIVFSAIPTLQLTTGRKDDSTSYDASMQNFTNNNTSQFKFLIFSSNGATRYLNWYATGY